VKQHFQMFAAYNSWANQRVYDAAAELDDDELNRDTGAFFRSMTGTLNHLLAADRIWMKRFTGEGDAPASLDEILFDELPPLRAAREAEDRRIVKWDGDRHAHDLAAAGALARAFLQSPDAPSRPGPHDPHLARPAVADPRPDPFPAHRGGPRLRLTASGRRMDGGGAGAWHGHGSRAKARPC
jgi:hypothetical protein